MFRAQLQNLASIKASQALLPTSNVSYKLLVTKSLALQPCLSLTQPLVKNYALNSKYNRGGGRKTTRKKGGGGGARDEVPDPVCERGGRQGAARRGQEHCQGA